MPLPLSSDINMVQSKLPKGLIRYLPVDSLHKTLLHEHPCKLDWNESTYSNPKVRKEVISYLYRKNSINWYPDHKQTSLKKEIAQYCSCKESQILVTNGSDQALELLCRAYLDITSKIFVPVPTYSNFITFAQATRAKIILHKVDFAEKYFDTLLSSIPNDMAMIYLVNPYVHTFSQEEIRKIVTSFPKSMVIVDEAYVEFCQTNLTSLLEYQNVVITRSFSKAFALAGLRLGYLLANEKTIDEISKIHNFKSVNVLAHIAGIEALRDLLPMKKYVQEVQISEKVIEHTLKKLNFTVKTTDAGFILFRHNLYSAQLVQSKLERRGVFVRNLEQIGQLYGYLRMNIADEPMTKKLLNVFISVFTIKAAFIDRDGTIIDEPQGTAESEKVITKVSQIKILPSAIQRMKKLQQQCFTFFVISNQDGIARGQITLEEYEQMNLAIDRKLRQKGIYITRWMVCPHDRFDHCNCRKPKTRMIDILSKNYYIDFKNSVIIGDRETDVQLGKKLGIPTIKVST